MAVVNEVYGERLPVAVDVLGGDNLDQVWDGVKQAFEQGLPMLLVGPESQVKGHGVDYIAADVQVPMNTSGDTVSEWVRGPRSKETTMYMAVQAVAEGRASAVFSAGSSAGMYAVAHSVLGFQKRTSRPGIATSIPRLTDMSGFNVLCDSGAHIAPSPEAMVYNAVLASVVARVRHGTEEPVVAFLANGEETSKGDSTTKAARHILAHVDLPLGRLHEENVEGKHLTANTADVIVANGLLGNVALKTIEGAAKAALFGYANYLNYSLAMSDFESLCASYPQIADMLPVLQSSGLSAQDVTRLVTTIAGTELIGFGYGPAHPDSYGGAVIPGMNGIVVIGHGSIKANGIPNAVKTSLDLSASGLVGATAQALEGFDLPKELVLEAKQKYGLVNAK